MAGKNPRALLGALKARLRRAISRSQVPNGENAPPDQLSGEQLAEVQGFFRRPKFFIFGYPRSGKTLLARLVRLHPEVHCNWHARFFNQRSDFLGQFNLPALETWLDRKSNHWTYGEGLTTPLIRVMCDYILERDAARHNKRIVGDETPNHNHDESIRRLYIVYPDAYLIYMVRDGRDSVFWRRIQLFIDKPDNLGKKERDIRDAFTRDQDPFLRGERSLFSPEWLGDAARDWATNVRKSDSAGHSLFGSRYLPLRYEDLLGNPTGLMTQVWSFLGAQAPTASLEQALFEEINIDRAARWHAEKDPDLVKDLYSNPIGIWAKLFTGKDRSLFEEIAGRELDKWGYQRSDS